MVVHKRKKVNKYRSHTTHGGGHRKKRRGAGSRGGRGNAGTGKRAGHKRFTFGNKIGSKGFTSKSKSNINTINLKDVEKLVNAGKAQKDGDANLIDLNKLGYNKLLGTGKTNLKLKIIVDSCSAGAEEKVKAAGGEIVSEGKKEKTVEKEEVEEKSEEKEESVAEKTEVKESEE